ncbi:hypothetical protein LILAB_18925 [Corallococcus macrosporus]|uniref:Uncharacterized protein n=1 Tax=Myxococcus fulvus (strain ATCC BAA-855 / HW-1) TaxID=483219 RepID=F8C7T6_MYXFH|nr:hypothetical protein LILAB_18925 [Corallococcus macrosporus]
MRWRRNDYHFSMEVTDSGYMGPTKLPSDVHGRSAMSRRLAA